LQVETFSIAGRYTYRKARLWAANETQLELGTFPTICPFGLEEMLDEDFWPD